MRTDDECLVDREYLETISGGDRDFERELFAVFVQTAEAMVHDVASAWLAHDPVKLSRAAHKLKGSARSIGLRQLGELCYIIEMAGHENMPDRVTAQMLTDLKRMVQAASAYMEVTYPKAA